MIKAVEDFIQKQIEACRIYIFVIEIDKQTIVTFTVAAIWIDNQVPNIASRCFACNWTNYSKIRTVWIIIVPYYKLINRFTIPVKRTQCDKALGIRERAIVITISLNGKLTTNRIAFLHHHIHKELTSITAIRFYNYCIYAALVALAEGCGKLCTDEAGLLVIVLHSNIDRLTISHPENCNIKWERFILVEPIKDLVDKEIKSCKIDLLVAEA